MREIRPSGSEGGAAQTNASSLPLLRREPASEEIVQIRIKAPPALARHAVAECAVVAVTGVSLSLTPGYYGRTALRFGNNLCAGTFNPDVQCHPEAPGPGRGQQQQWQLLVSRTPLR